jgi:hypothetical protein
MQIKYILFLILFLSQKANAQKVFNQLTDYSDDFFSVYYNGYSCPTFKDGSVIFDYYDKDFKYDTSISRFAPSVLKKYNTEGNIVSKIQLPYMKNKGGDTYRFDFFQEYEERLYGIGSKTSAVKNRYNMAKDYYVVAEFDKNTLQPIYTNEYTLFAGYDSFGFARQLINGTPPIIDDNKFFQTGTNNADSITGKYDSFYYVYLNFNFREKKFYSKTVSRDSIKNNRIIDNAIKIGKDTFCTFFGSLSTELNGGKRYNDIYIFDKELNFFKPSTIKFVDTLSYYAVTGSYDLKSGIIKGDSSYIFSYTHVELKKKGIGFDTIRGLHKYKFYRDTFYYDGVIDTGFYPYGYYMGKGYAVNNYILDPVDSGYYLSFYDNNFARNNSFVIYKFDKNFKVNWKRRYIEDSINLVGISQGSANICMGYDYKRGGVVIPFDAMNPSGSNVFLLWVDRNGNPLKIGGKDLTGSSIIDYNSKIDVQIYPNPTQDFLHIIFEKNNNANAIYRIYNLEGKFIKEEKLRSSIDVSSLSKGNYILQILKQDFEIIANKRFVKE